MKREMEFESETDLLRFQVRRLREILQRVFQKYKEDLAKLIKVEEENKRLRRENKILKSRPKN